MKKLMTFCMAVLLSVAAFGSPHVQNRPTATPAPVHNGLWWQNKSSLFLDGFVAGYKSGSLHGSGRIQAINQFPASELIDGLNSFYKDFRNRNIVVDDALNYVLDQLRGTPDDKLKGELLKMRAAAAPNNPE